MGSASGKPTILAYVAASSSLSILISVFIVQSETMDIPVMSAVFEHELGVTSTFLDRSLSASLDKFRNFRKLSKMNKEKELLKLQRGSVLSDYLNWYRNRSYQDLEDATSQLLSKWKHVGRPKTASLINTDILVAERLVWSSWWKIFFVL